MSTFVNAPIENKYPVQEINYVFKSAQFINMQSKAKQELLRLIFKILAKEITKRAKSGFNSIVFKLNLGIDENYIVDIVLNNLNSLGYRANYEDKNDNKILNISWEVIDMDIDANPIAEKTGYFLYNALDANYDSKKAKEEAGLLQTKILQAAEMGETCLIIDKEDYETEFFESLYNTLTCLGYILKQQPETTKIYIDWAVPKTVKAINEDD